MGLLCVLLLAYLSLGAQAVLPIPYDLAVATVWTFENETWIENLAVRQNGEVLCTSINRAALYLVDPFAHTETLVHQFEPTDGLLGISEVQNDVFVVASANISLATSTSYPGSAKIWKVDMVAWELGEPNPVNLIANLSDVGLPDGIATLDYEAGVVLLADASRGLVWRVDVETGNYTVAIQDDQFVPTNQEIPLGVDGVHILNDYLYFTNLGSNLLGRIPISQNGSALGPVENVTTSMIFPDDFAVAPNGTAYVAGGNTLYRVQPGGKVEALAGGPNDLVLEGATSAQFGRTRMDQDVLYIGTNGGILAPVQGVVHGGQLLAINVGLFE